MMMRCFDINQMALYLTTYGLGEKERRAYEQHLAECPACRDKINRLQRRLRELDVDNKAACEEKREALEAYAVSQLPDDQRENVLQHTGECHACNAYLSRLASFPDLPEAAAWDIPIPPRFAENIEAALERKLKVSHRKAEDQLRKTAEGVKEFLSEIRLSLLPLAPAWGFRGQEETPPSDFVEVEHAGGDLVLNVGITGVIVTLYSNREKYLDDGEADGQGRVSFADMKPGVYKIRVQGHKIAKTR
jgi:hypothetical protein